MPIPTSYVQKPLVHTGIDKAYIKVDCITDIQLQSLLVLGLVKQEHDENCMPLYVSSLNTVAFYYPQDLHSLVNLLKVYAKHKVRVVCGETMKILDRESLYEMLFE